MTHLKRKSSDRMHGSWQQPGKPQSLRHRWVPRDTARHRETWLCIFPREDDQAQNLKKSKECSQVQGNMKWCNFECINIYSWKTNKNIASAVSPSLSLLPPAPCSPPPEEGAPKQCMGTAEWNWPNRVTCMYEYTTINATLMYICNAPIKKTTTTN